MTLESLTLAKEISFSGNDFCMITNLFINRTMNREYEIAEYYSTIQDLSLEDIEKIYKVICNLIDVQEDKDNTCVPMSSSDVFTDWANIYFSKDSGHLDCMIGRSEAFDNFMQQSKVMHRFWTMRRFMKYLRGFVADCPYISALNPEDLSDDEGRIVCKDDAGGIKEMLYLKSCNK